MSYGYGKNPYDQRGDSPSRPLAQGYDAQQSYNAPTMGRDEYSGRNVEMEPLTSNGGQFGGQGDPNAILNECRDIDRGIDEIERSLEQLKALQQRSLDDPDSSAQSATNRQLDALGAETMTMYRNFASRIRAIKSQPESGSPKNAPQVGKVDRKLKKAINDYQNVESTFRRKLQEQMARQYRIVRPDASDAEVKEAVEDTSNNQVFSQALLQSDRRGQSRAALNAVENRHQAIQKIEQQMIELAQLFQDMEALVVQQEAAVEAIDQRGEEVVENLDKGTQEIGHAIVSAKARNRKKWWCLGICVLIIVIVIIIVLIWKFVISGGSNNKKRWIATDVAPAIDNHLPKVSARFVVPGLEWSEDDKLVVPTTATSEDTVSIDQSVESHHEMM
ncbi:SNARE domain-containing protein [Xylogone sp. PMI_703]|nr:SNARE domain-containing protein [Xylogone sp. PMI_703]